MDEGNRQAENGVDTAVKYLAQNNLATINKRSVVDFMTDDEPAQAVGKGEIIMISKNDNNDNNNKKKKNNNNN